MRRGVRGLALVAVAAVIASILTGLAAPTFAAEVPSAPYTVLSLQGDGPGLGFSMWEPAVDGSTIGFNGGFMQATLGPTWANVFLAPPDGQSLEVGHYTTAQVADATHAMLDVGNSGAGCSTSTGVMDVLEMSRSGGEVVAFAADFRFTCGTYATVIGVMRYHSTIAYAVDQVQPFALNLGVVAAGVANPPHPVTVTSRGTEPLTMAAASLTGPSAASFQVVTDTCAGKTLAWGQSCTLSVAAQPVELNPSLTASLSVSDGTRYGGPQVALTAHSLRPARGTFEPGSRRLLDTRRNPGKPVAAGSTIHLQIPSLGYLPSQGTSAVALNLTETGATSGGYVTAYPTGQPRPVASSINYVHGVTRANMVIVKVGAGGKVDLYNCCGHVHLVVDLLGWFAAGNSQGAVYGSTLQTYRPERVVDSRKWSPAGLPPRWEDTVAFDYGSDVNASMSAVLVAVTAIRPRAPGYLTAYSGVSDPTQTSTVNLQPGVTTPNLAIVPTQRCRLSWCAGYPSIRVFNGSSKTTNFLVDVLGVFAGNDLQYGQRYEPLTPRRIVDTRLDLGAGRLGPASTTTITPPAPPTDYYTGAVMTNATVIKPTVNTYLSSWLAAPNVTRPTVSFANPSAGTTVANAMLVQAGVDNAFNVYNASGSTDLAIDLAGTFQYWPLDFPAAPAVTRTGLVRTTPVAPHRPATSPGSPRVQVAHQAPWTGP